MSKLSLPLVALLLAAALPAQELVWERTGIPNQTEFYGPVSVIGDIDRDGYPDLAVVGWRYFPGKIWYRRESEVFLLSGRDGRTIRSLGVPVSGDRYDAVTAAGDLDRDGIPDYGVMRIEAIPNVVEIRSGADDRVLWSKVGSFPEGFGLGILGGADLDRDGTPDMVVTASNKVPSGSVYVYSGHGHLLYEIVGTPQLRMRFSSVTAVGRLGDFNGDGADDFLLGAIDTVVGLGAALVVSGPTGAILTRGYGPPSQAIGHAVDGCGDMDRDGVLDFVASSSNGVAVAFSGRTAQALHTWWGPSKFGSGLACSGQDLDQDGLPDVVVGAPFASVTPPPTTRLGSVFVYSGRSGAQLHRIDSEQGEPGLGTYLAAVPAFPGSPFPSMALTEPLYGVYTTQWGSIENRGRVRLFRGAPAGTAAYGQPCRGTLAAAPRIGMQDLGAQGARLHLSNAAPASPALLLAGVAPLSVPVSLNPFGFTGCTLYPAAQFFVPAFTGATGIASGYTSLDIPLPLRAPGAVTLHGQWVSIGAGASYPGALSAAMRWQH